MESHLFLSQFERLLPLAIAWATEQEQLILRDGVPLSEGELADARRVEVQHPGRVRLLRVDVIPSPTDPILQAASQATNLIPAAPRGLTLFYGVFVRSDCWRERNLIVHELVHTAQYERLGGIAPFLRRYLLECASLGYSASSLEDQAIRGAAGVCVS